MIWDLRIKQPVFLSHSTVDAADACCGYLCDEVTSEYTIVSSEEEIDFYNYNDAVGTLLEGTISQGEQQVICSSTVPDTQGTFEGVTITYTRCGCSS